MDLFSFQQDSKPQARLLADRLRPEHLDEYIGQEHIIGPGNYSGAPSRLIRFRPSCYTALRDVARQPWHILFPSKRKDSSYV